MDRVREGDLYALLAMCSAEDLDPIVNILLAAPSNRLKQTTVYKKFSPNHVKYHMQIGDELRRFGGDTLHNLSHGGEGPSYDEIVLDVCRRLDIPCKPGDVVGNELGLLALYMQRQWDELTDAQRSDLIASGRKKVSESAAGLVKQAKAALGLQELRVLPLVRRPVLPLTGPIYRVTAPCVLHIAFLRRRLSEAMTLVVGAPMPGNGVELGEDATGFMIIGENDDRPLLSLKPVGAPAHAEGWQDVAPNDDRIGRLNPLLQAVPSIVSAAEGFGAFGATYYKVVADGILANSRDTAGAFRGIVLEGGRIKSHAELFKPERLQAILAPAALLQIASVIVGQVHLADISKKLASISLAVERIASFQQEGRRAGITAAIGYFRQVAAPILHGELDASVRAQLESGERDLLAICIHIEQEIKDEISQFAKLKDNEMIGSANFAAAIRTAQNRLSDLNMQHLLCLRARVYGVQLLAAFPNAEVLRDTRLTTILAGLGSVTDRDARLAGIATLMRGKISQMSSAWNMTATNQKKLDLLEWNDKFTTSVTAGFEEIVRAVDAARGLHPQAKAPAAMIAKVQEGRIVAICPEPLVSSPPF